MSDSNLSRYGLLPDRVSADNPYGVPVGMTVEESTNAGLASFKVVGFNCAACHVGAMEAEGRIVRIDGAPNMLDIKRFNRDLVTSLESVLRPAAALAFFARMHSVAEPSDSGRARGEAPEMRRSMLDGIGETTLGLYRQLPTLEKLQTESAAGKLLARDLEIIVARETSHARRLGREELIESHLGKDHPSNAESVSTKNVGRPRGEAAGNKDKVQASTRKGHAVRTVNAEASIAEFGSYASPALRNALASKQPIALVPGTPRGGDLRLDVLRFVTDFSLTVRWLSQRLALLKMLEGLDAVSENILAGPGRVDAFVTARNMLFGKEYAIRTTSPICFPHLWGFARNRWLHWDGNTTSVLERNIGQALGLGAFVDPKTFESSINVRNLHELEQYARGIPSPTWPFTPPEPSEVEAGSRLFAAHCQQCHGPDRRPEDGAGVDVGTDRERLNTFNQQLAGQPFPLALSAMLQKVKSRAFDQAGLSAGERATWESVPSEWRSTSTYATRALDGIWASPPYLHNGSVPSLEELLRPPEHRIARFQVGSRRFDTSKVGYATDDGPFLFDTTLPGNSNRGHAYGVGLDPTERAQLIAFLKTL